MNLTPITAKNDAQDAFVRVRTALTKGAKSSVKEVGWPGGHGKYTVYWHADYGFWTLLRTHLDNRFWLAFGTQNPFKATKSLDITCEINPPKSGRNGRCAGVFLRDSSG